MKRFIALGLFAACPAFAATALADPVVVGVLILWPSAEGEPEARLEPFARLSGEEWLPFDGTSGGTDSPAAPPIRPGDAFRIVRRDREIGRFVVGDGPPAQDEMTGAPQVRGEFVRRPEAGPPSDRYETFLAVSQNVPAPAPTLRPSEEDVEGARRAAFRDAPALLYPELHAKDRPPIDDFFREGFAVPIDTGRRWVYFAEFFVDVDRRISPVDPRIGDVSRFLTLGVGFAPGTGRELTAFHEGGREAPGEEGSFSEPRLLGVADLDGGGVNEAVFSVAGYEEFEWRIYAFREDEFVPVFGAFGPRL